MNCREFENALVDVARGIAIAETMAHARSCSRCAARLQAETALSGWLRGVSAAAADVQAPPRVERALLTAFREERKIGRSRRWWVWAAGTAAMASAAVLLVVAVGNRKVVEAPRSGTVAAKVVPAAVPVVQERTTGQAPVTGKIRPTPRRRQARRPAPPAEASGFVALPGTYTAAPLDAGHAVRVRFRRGALAAFGFPVLEERADDRVQADVIVGEDGLAHAIRFVRER